MSAGAAGQGVAGGDAGGESGGEGQGAPAFDAQALQSQLSETLGNELREQFGQFVQSAPWQQQEAAQEPPQDDVDLSFLDAGYGDPAFGEAERAAQAQAFQQAVERQVQQYVTPLQEQQQEMVRQQQARDLIAEHPELQDREVAEAVVRQAQQVAHDMGKPELGNDPTFWKLVHQASRATAAANAEGAESPTAAHLEGGGGAGPAGGQQVDVASQILGAPGERRGSGVLPY